MNKHYFLLLFFLPAFFACRQRYDPKIADMDKAFLVVEGNLNVNHDTTIVRLTKTYQLDEKAKIGIENNAQVTVEGRDNTVRALAGRGNGYYLSPDLNLIVNNEYRLRIKTANGKEYLSEFVKARPTPVFDSISVEASKKGVDIFVNTKDVSNATRYYRWEYDEAWEIRSAFYSRYQYDTPQRRVRERLPHEMVNQCWRYDSSKVLILANSTRVADDVIYKMPVRHLEPFDDRLSVKYSIQVKQYALDKNAYQFFELMKKNTEDLGSVFGPLPSELRGNIHCLTDPDEYVLGFVTACAVEKKRIFITYDDFINPDLCLMKEVVQDSADIYFRLMGYIPFEADFFSTPNIFYSGTAMCVDCRVRGGNLRRPYFWQ
jgi:hypothetical protein